jgi:hypothetical protein
MPELEYTDATGAQKGVALARRGYKFAGYFDGESDAAAKYYNADGSSATNWDKTADTTLYAHWEQVTYPVMYNANGGDNAVLSMMSLVKFDEVWTPDNYYGKNGTQVFNVWNTESDGSGLVVRPDFEGLYDVFRDDGNIATLYAQFEAPTTLKTETVFAETSPFLGIPDTERGKITSIEFQSVKPKCTTPLVNIGTGSGVGSNNVFACVSADNTGLVIGQQEGVLMNPNSSHLFENLRSAPKMLGFADYTLNWDKVTDTSYMFASFGNSTKGSAVAIPEFPYNIAYKATNMSHMFDSFGANAGSATLTLPAFSAGSGAAVKDISYMFANFAANSTATAITLPDLPTNFGRQATTMSNMFANAAKGSTTGLTSDIKWNQTSFSAKPDTTDLFAGMNWGGKKLTVPNGNKSMYDLFNGVPSGAGNVGYF